MLTIGILLLIAEVFIPSGGLISIAASVCLISAVFCAWNAWWARNPTYFWSFLAGMALLLPTTVCVAFYIWPSTPIGKRAILEAPRPEDVASFVELEQLHAHMVGRMGQTLTMLNPAGIVRIDGHRVHCQSEGLIIDVGTTVRVISAQGNRVVVRRCSPDDKGATSDTAAPVTPPAEASLDFDIS
jgi:membrane-bound ClpP family serine protease